MQLTLALAPSSLSQFSEEEEEASSDLQQQQQQQLNKMSVAVVLDPDCLGTVR